MMNKLLSEVLSAAETPVSLAEIPGFELPKGMAYYRRHAFELLLASGEEKNPQKVAANLKEAVIFNPA